jgi:hypothetical protein
MHCQRNLGVQAVALALAALLLAAPARAVEVDKLLPNDTETVLSINVKQMLTAPLTQKLPVNHAKELLKNQAGDAHKILTDLGFDPFTDLDSITVASAGDSEPDKGLIIAHGKFDMAKFKAKAEEVAKDNENTLKIHKVPDGKGGQTQLYEATIPNSPQPLFAALLSSNTIVASAGKDYVLDAIDKEAGKKTTKLKSKELEKLLGRIDAKQCLWVAVLGSTLAKNPFLSNNDDAKQIIEKLDDAIAGITIDKDLKVELAVTAKNANDAKELDEKIKDGLNTALGFAALAATNNKEVAPLVDLLKNVKPTVKEKVVSLEIEIPGSAIEKVIDKNK